MIEKREPVFADKGALVQVIAMLAVLVAAILIKPYFHEAFGSWFRAYHLVIFLAIAAGLILAAKWLARPR